MSPTRSAADRQYDGPQKTRARMALAFVALALIALAVVPIYLGQRAARVQEQITEHLQPALLASAELSLAQARLVDLLQRFLPAGEGSYRTQDNAAVAREESRYGDLAERVEVEGHPRRLVGCELLAEVASCVVSLEGELVHR